MLRHKKSDAALHQHYSHKIEYKFCRGVLYIVQVINIVNLVKA